MPIVYKLTCKPTGQIYFGWTVMTLAQRFSKHCRSKRHYYISRCIQKYGAENFVAEPLFEFDSNEVAATKEKELIAEYKTNICHHPDGNGLNMTDGGEWGTQGYKHDDSAKQKIRDSSTGRKRSKKTQDLINELIKKRGSYWNKGRKVTEEENRKRSESLKKSYEEGRHSRRTGKISEEHKSKISTANKGRKFSQEHREKISNARKGIKFSEEHKQKIRLARTGSRQSPETIEKRVSKLKGKKLRKRTPEEREKMKQHFAEYYKNNPHARFGKEVSSETRKKMRKSRLAYIEKIKGKL